MFFASNKTDSVDQKKKLVTDKKKSVIDRKRVDRLVVDSIPLSILFLDEDGIILETNQAVREMLDMLEGEIEGMHITDIFSGFDQFKKVTYNEDSLPGHLELFSNEQNVNVRESGTLMESLYIQYLDSDNFKRVRQHQLRNGETKWLSLSVERDELDEENVYILTLYDITQNILKQQEIERINNELEDKIHQRTQVLVATNQSLSEAIHELTATQDMLLTARKLNSLSRFVKNSAHIFNTPVGVLITGLSAALDSVTAIASKAENNQLKKSELTNSLSKAVESCQISLQQAEFLSKIVSRLKTLSFEYIDTHVQRGDVREFVLNGTEGWQQKLAIQIETLTSNYPAWVAFSESLLDIAFCELLSNIAMHAYPQDQQKQAIITLEDHPTEIVITISDNGVGVDKKLLTRLFEPFVYGGKHSTEAVGLGLTLVHSIITLHCNGNIDLANNPEGGFAVTITLPK